MSTQLLTPQTLDNTIDNILDNMSRDNLSIISQQEYENENENGNGNENGKNNNTNNTNNTNVIGWNDKNERMVINIGENAASYKWMHEKSTNFYKTIHQILSILMILFSAGLSAETVLPTVDEFIITALRSAFTYAITLISVLQNFLKYEKLAQQHSTSAKLFGNLYHDIQQQMCSYRKDRKPASTYISKILKEYDNLIVNGPSINAFILNNFKKTFKNAEIAIPDIADRIQKIEIVTEPEPTARILGVASKELKNKETNSKNAKNEMSSREFDTRSVCHLNQIHQAFQNNCRDTESNNSPELIQMRNIRKHHLNSRSDFEFNRFRQHDNM